MENVLLEERVLSTWRVCSYPSKTFFPKVKYILLKIRWYIKCGARHSFLFKWHLQWRSLTVLIKDSLSIFPHPHFHSAFFLLKDSDSYSPPCQGPKVIPEMVWKCKPPIQLNPLWTASHPLLHLSPLPLEYCNTSHWIGMLVTGASLQFNSRRSLRSALLCIARVCPPSSTQVALLAFHPPFNCSKPASESQMLWSLCNTSRRRLKYFLAPSWCNSMPHMAHRQLLKRSKHERNKYLSVTHILVWMHAWDEFPPVEKHVSSNWMRKKVINNVSTQSQGCEPRV